MKKIYILITIILFSSINDINAQRRKSRRRNSASKIQHEIGGNIGISNFQGDFNGDGPLDGLIQINGFTLNATHSAHIVPTRRTRYNNRFSKHLILKTNLGITTGSFDNLGVSTGKEPLTKNGDPTKVDSDVLLGKLTAKTTIVTLGTQVEYYLRNIITYLHRNPRRRGKRRGFRGKRRYYKGNPYIGLGLGINFVNSEEDYPFEQLKNQNVGNNTLFPGLPDNFTSESIKGVKETTFSATLALGYRYKLNPSIDLVGEMKFNQYFSDRIDALNPEVGNDNLDKNTNLTVGVIYSLF